MSSTEDQARMGAGLSAEEKPKAGPSRVNRASEALWWLGMLATIKATGSRPADGTLW